MMNTTYRTGMCPTKKDLTIRGLPAIFSASNPGIPAVLCSAYKSNAQLALLYSLNANS